MPDFMLEITSGRGDKRKELVELISYQLLPYSLPHVGRQHVRAVQGRARVLTGQYLGKAIGVDQIYEGSVGRLEVGRVQSELESSRSPEGQRVRQGGIGGLSGDDQEAAQCGSNKKTGRLLDNQTGQCGRVGWSSWEEETEGHQVGEEVG